MFETVEVKTNPRRFSCRIFEDFSDYYLEDVVLYVRYVLIARDLPVGFRVLVNTSPIMVACHAVKAARTNFRIRYDLQVTLSLLNNSGGRAINSTQAMRDD